ncbi:hypothetical protein ACFL60_04105 [Candidatus Omnitrophota bacterium]
MKSEKMLKWVFFLLSVITIFFFMCCYGIYLKSYKDPRWRIFDYNSRQATEGDIYNVAEIPVVKSVDLVGERKLRFEFAPPFDTEAWKIISAEDKRLVNRDVFPEIQFPDERLSDTFIFIPEDVKLMKEIVIKISFYPKERYHEQGLSWPDNYYSPYSSIPFSIREPHSLDEWAGLSDKDPDMVAARDIMGKSVNKYAPVVERSEQVFRFIMEKIDEAGGVPSDELQNASPLRTYEMLSSGEGKGWCENRALVYYLYANAAGIKTRLVDIAGKFGPLKLTGHYFCESFDPIQAKWYFVDPMSRAAHVMDTTGKLLHTLELKKMFDLDCFNDISVLTYDRETKTLVTKTHEALYNGNKGYFTGDIVLAYKFGYPKNRNYSKLDHFLHYPTLLYAPFALPRLYLIKKWCLICCMVSFVLTIAVGTGALYNLFKEKTV